VNTPHRRSSCSRCLNRLVICAAIVLVWAGPSSTLHSVRAQAPPARRPDVLLVPIDTLRADRLGSYGYKLTHTQLEAHRK
jgi:hypothetical protein